MVPMYLLCFSLHVPRSSAGRRANQPAVQASAGSSGHEFRERSSSAIDFERFMAFDDLQRFSLATPMVEWACRCSIVRAV